MTNVYEWLDPFEERARVQSECRRAHQDGRREALDWFMEENQGAWRGTVRRAISDLAERVAWTAYEHWRDSYADYRQAKAQVQAYVDYAMYHPVSQVISNEGALRLDIREGFGVRPDELMVTTYLARPFEYTVRMMNLPPAPSGYAE